MSANPPRVTLNRRELLDAPSFASQRVLRVHLSDLRTHWKKPITAKGQIQLTKRLLSINALFLLHRFNDCGIYTVDDLRHMAGLVVKWEYEGLYRTGLGLINCGSNWKALKDACATLRKEEAEELETRFKIPALQRQALRERYRLAAVMLWSKKRSEDIYKAIPGEAMDPQVKSAFAACTLDLPRF